MRTLESGGQLAGYVVENGAGRHYSQKNCPPGIRPAVEKAISRGQVEGTVAGAGRVWRWHTLPAESVTIQIIGKEAA